MMINNWDDLITELKKDFSIPGDLLSVLFLVGIQESGGGFRSYDQQEKTDLVKLGKFSLLSRAGYYEKVIIQGRPPFFIPVDDRPLPRDPKKLDTLLKNEILNYFRDNITK